MRIDKELIEDNLHVFYSYDDFKFYPYLDLYKINILKKILAKQEKKNKFIMTLINSYKLLNKKDPILPDNIYNEYKKELVNEQLQNKQIYVSTHKKNNKIYFEYKNIFYHLTLENYYRIKKRFLLDKNKEDIHIYIFCLLNRYNFLELLNGLSGSIHKDHYNKLNKDYNAKLEGFSSFYNSNLKYYCGLFPDLEKHFGCLCNIFNIVIKKGISIFNPPFNVKFMNEFFSFITDKKHNGTFLFILPAFKIKDRIKLNNVCKTKQNIDYKDDYNIDTLRNNSNIKLDYLYCKNNFIYYDFLLNKNINYTSTNVLIINTTKNDNIDNFSINNIFGKPDIILKKI